MREKSVYLKRGGFISLVTTNSRLVTKLKLFREVSEKVASQEFDQAFNAMDKMRQTLYSSLTIQWATQQQRDSEMATLAHNFENSNYIDWRQCRTSFRRKIK